jgi:hypothetical protein
LVALNRYAVVERYEVELLNLPDKTMPFIG